MGRPKKLANEVWARAALAVSQPMLVVDRQMRIQGANGAAERTLGWRADDIIGKELCALVSCRDANGSPGGPDNCWAYRRVAVDGDSCCGEFQFTRHDGDIIPVGMSYTPLVEQGKVVAIVSTFDDVSERKRAATDAQARERHFRVLFNLGQLALAHRIPLDTLLDEAVRGVAFGLGVELCNVLELLRDGEFLLRAGVGWQPGLVGAAKVDAGLDTQAGFTMQGDNPVVAEDILHETRFRSPSLLFDHDVISGISVAIGARGAPFGMLGAYACARREFNSEDVGFMRSVANLLAVAVQRARHEEQLESHTQALEDATKQLRDQQFALDQHSIVAVTDQTGKITYVNDKFCEISKYTREELIGQNHRILKSDHHPGEFFRDMWRTIAKGKVWQGEIRNRNKLGEHYWVDTTIVPFLNGKGKPYQYVAIRTDITQRMHIEDELAHARDAALEASRQKSEFLATMSHEIRTPMNGVLGMAELLLDSPLSQYQREQAHTIFESANALLDIINDVLDFSKIEAGRMSFEEEDFAPGEVVESVGEILAPKARQKGLALLIRIDSGLPPVLRGDSGRLRQVLLNLVGNAVKFTPHGEVLVDARVDKTLDTAMLLHFSVTDTGVGMSPQVLERLFEPFTQADSSTTRLYGGTGLGLSISKRLIEMMGGEIHVESREGEGSTFQFSLPLRHAHAQTKSSRKRHGRELKGVRVLVAAETPHSRDILQHYLQSGGCDCVVTDQGEAALAQLRRAASTRRPFDVVVADLDHSEMDAHALAGKIRAEASLAQLRLVMVSSSNELGACARAMREGFHAYLSKPVRREHLFKGLQRRAFDEALVPLPEPAVPMPLANLSDSDRVLLPGAKSVLLVEDNQVNQLIAMRQLERLGYAVHIASNGPDALNAVMHEDFALVLMDCQMPEMDGFEVTTRIRKWEAQSGKPRLPIVAMTANVLQGDSERCIAAGMDDFLGKPVRIDKLQKMLDKWKVKPSHRYGAAPQQQMARVDVNAIESLRGELGDYVSEIIDSYLDSTPALLEQLMRAYEARDFNAVQQFAHTLKSSSLQLGFNRLGEMASNLILRIRAGDLTIGGSEIERLFEEFRRAELELRGASPETSIYRRRGMENQPLVLVVDDDETVRMVLRRAMEEEGFHVEEAASGYEAVDRCETLRPDIVLMDCMMPGMNGFETCERLQLMPEDRRMPVLMITGLADEFSAQRAIHSGAADFINKPVYIPVLRQRVKHLLEMKQVQEHVRHLAYHDTLTGLPNRVLFNDRLQLAIAAAKRGGYRLATLFLDLDNFKTVNESLGHTMGDQLLKEVAERISALLRDEDTLSRMGGDEFTLLMPQLPQGSEGVRGVQVAADKIIESLKMPFFLNDQEIYIGVSIGVSIYPEDGEEAAGLLKNADTAMYWAKAAGRNRFCLYSTAMNAQMAERLHLESGLRKALERDELVVYYQPQMSLKSGRLVGVEALLRWRHPELGLVAPGKFIPLAEESGLIVDIGAWVLKTACRQCKAWHERGHDYLTVAVNLSARQFQAGNLVEVVEEALRESGLPAGALDVEVTESITIHGSSGPRDALCRLKELGVKVSMDDFGTGYSSLSYLKRFPIDVLKIDQSFVRDVVTDPSDAAIVETIIAMAKTLRMQVLAEGVETVEQMEFLYASGCEMVQGYYIGRPQPAAKLEKLLVDGSGLVLPAQSAKKGGNFRLPF